MNFAVSPTNGSIDTKLTIPMTIRAQMRTRLDREGSFSSITARSDTMKAAPRQKIPTTIMRTLNLRNRTSSRTLPRPIDPSRARMPAIQRSHDWSFARDLDMARPAAAR